FETAVRDALTKIGKNLTFHRVGSMFCLFFKEGPVWNVDDVTNSDFDAFKKFFWSALDMGVYFAPSQYEAGFISVAHGANDLEQTIEATEAGLNAAYG
ncbi:MAG: aspartate aminotransferase family protein, partial [Verrucomicrobiota bacterium]